MRTAVSLHEGQITAVNAGAVMTKLLQISLGGSMPIDAALLNLILHAHQTLIDLVKPLSRRCWCSCQARPCRTY